MMLPKALSFDNLNAANESKSPEPQSDEDIVEMLLHLEMHSDDDIPQHWFVDSPYFKYPIIFLVLVSTVQMGVEADHPELYEVWTMFELFSTAVFLVEILLKLVFLRLSFFEDNFNLLDMGLVAMAVLDNFIFSFFVDVDLQSFSIFRVLRIVRFLRVMKLAKHHKQIMLVLTGIWHSMQAALWVAMILLIAIYMSAIFCVNYIGRDGKDLYPGYSTDLAEIDEMELMTEFNPYLAFGSMARAMFTLFNIATLSEWPEILRPLAVKQPLLVIFFVLFAVFITMGAMNVVVGMIVDNVTQEAANFEKHKKADRLAKKKQVIGHIQGIWREMAGGAAKISSSVLEASEHNSHSHLQRLLLHTELPSSFGSRELFELLDDDADGEVSEKELLEGFLQLMEGEPFQHACMLKRSINILKRELVSLTAEMTRQHESVLAAVRESAHETVVRFGRTISASYSPLCEEHPPATATIVESLSTGACQGESIPMWSARKQRDMRPGYRMQHVSGTDADAGAGTARWEPLPNLFPGSRLPHMAISPRHVPDVPSRVAGTRRSHIPTPLPGSDRVQQEFTQGSGVEGDDVPPLTAEHGLTTQHPLSTAQTTQEDRHRSGALAVASTHEGGGSQVPGAPSESSPSKVPL